jgi:8-oxo-dGTP pyrophosphatase MutT (NUDIX family)
MVIERQASRALLIAERSVLLIKGRDPARPERGTWWLTPGGGIEDGESPEAAVTREILEETGLVVAPDRVGAVVATRVAHFDFDERTFRQHESFFAVLVAPFTPTDNGWDDLERRELITHRWWTLDELTATDEVVYPSELGELVRAVLEGRIDSPMQLRGDERY